MQRATQGVFWILAAVTVMALAAEQSDLAHLYVRVEDHGKAKQGLVAKNFRVIEGEKVRIVSSAEPAGPASVVLLVENSEASWKYLNEVNSAMRGFLKTAPPWHSYSLVSYTEDPRVEAPMTSQASRIAQAYAGRKQSAWGRVAAYDALDQVLDEVEKLEGFRAVVVIGSGEDAFSQAEFEDLVRRVELTDVVVYSVQLGGSQVPALGTPKGLEDLQDIVSLGDGLSAEPPDLRRGEMFLRAIADRSGGDFYCPNCEAGYRTAIEEIVDSLESYYRVSYRRATPPNWGFAKLRVTSFRIDDDVRYDYRVKVRPGWRFSGSNP